MNLDELAIKYHNAEDRVSRTLLWGKPRGGKTAFAATIAKLPEIDRVFWFDLESGLETVIFDDELPEHYRLTAEERQKITVIRVQDTPALPLAAYTILKAFSATKPESICEGHGKIDCPVCKANGTPSVLFNLASLTPRDAVVIDSGSQLADSIVNMKLNTMKNANGSDVHLMQVYGAAGLDLTAVFSMLQAANTNCIVCTHEVDTVNKKEVATGTFPLVGSQAYSKKVGKYFGHVVYCEFKAKKFIKGSHPSYKQDYITGSRTGARLENVDNPVMKDLIYPDKSKETATNGRPVIGGGPAAIAKATAPTKQTATSKQASPAIKPKLNLTHR